MWMYIEQWRTAVRFILLTVWILFMLSEGYNFMAETDTADVCLKSSVSLSLSVSLNRRRMRMRANSSVQP